MKHLLKHADDLRWFITHTKSFQGGYITDVRMSKNRLFDEKSGRHLWVGTTVTVVIQYQGSDMLRTARLTMHGVSDFSIQEQEGEDASAIGAIQAEASDDRLRFWFDPEGRLYVVCEEVLFEELASPVGRDSARAVTRWTFQAEDGEVPTIEWVLNHLDRAGMPCVWRADLPRCQRHPAIYWQGELASSSGLPGRRGCSLHIMAHRSVGSSGFGMTLRATETADPHCGRVLGLVADLLARTFRGICLVGDTVLSCEEWLQENRREENQHVGYPADAGLP